MAPHRRTLSILCALTLAATLYAPVLASGDPLSGVCITSVPTDTALLLGNRQVRSGDVLTAEQFEKLTLSGPDRAVIRYLPVIDGHLEPEAELTISLPGRQNEPPTAEDSKLETYKNLPNEGLLTVQDPEGEALTYTLVRAPRRGEVILRKDGSFLYTPKKNKVGTDSFTYTATDPAGNVSREATVTVTIRKPTDDKRYTDTAAAGCGFEAQWLRCTGIFSGEEVGGQLCFCPEKEVSRGQFLAMLMQVLELPVDRNAKGTGFLDESPQWLRPYLAAAMRSGIISGYPTEGGVEFRPDQPVSESEAALMAARAMEFALPAASLDLPGSGDAPLTRSNAAKLLYRLDLVRRDQGGFFGLFQ